MTQRKSSEERAYAHAIGKRLRALRGSASQADFAAMFGITRSALANYEMGRSKASDDLINKVAAKFELNPSALKAGPDPSDFEPELQSLVGDGSKLTEDEWAMVRLLRLLLEEDLESVIATILRCIEGRRDILHLADPETVVVDLARLYTIVQRKGRYDRALTTANVVQLAKVLAGMAKS